MSGSHPHRKNSHPVPRSLRIGTFLLSVVLTFLTVWLLGFILRDIGDIEGPDRDKVFGQFVDKDLRERSGKLEIEISETEQQVQRQEQVQKDLKRSMDNARTTMQQMMDLQRLSLESEATPSVEERNALATAQNRFLEAQTDYEEANSEIAASNGKLFELRRDLANVQKEIRNDEEPAQEEFMRLQRRHQWFVALLKLAFIVPVFGIAAWTFYRRRHSPYRSILFAVLAASFWKVGVVMFDYFPRDYFKYIAILAAIAAVLAFLVWLLRKAAKPNRDLLLQRYREAYRSHNCPICAYPIARGPLRFANWTRKGPQRIAAAVEVGADESEISESPYACPSCGTSLYETCGGCGEIRHHLLPYCEHCGDEQFDPGEDPA